MCVIAHAASIVAQRSYNYNHFSKYNTINFITYTCRCCDNFVFSIGLDTLTGDKGLRIDVNSFNIWLLDVHIKLKSAMRCEAQVQR